MTAYIIMQYQQITLNIITFLTHIGLFGEQRRLFNQLGNCYNKL